MFKIFKDKDRLFKCSVDVQGANINDCSARLIFEFNDQIIMYKGAINENGQCKIVIPKIKKFEEGDSGKVTLEVIAENTLFESWKSEFEVTFDKKVNVVLENNDSSDIISEENKEVLNDKKVSVSIIDDEVDNVFEKTETPKNVEKTVEKTETHKKVEKIIEKNTKKKENKEYINEDVLDFETFFNKN
jgi:hypothetical protein